MILRIVIKFIILIIIGTSAIAQDIPSAIKIARQSVYRVGLTVGVDTFPVGTAWAISPNTLITNAHVVATKDKLEKSSGKKVSIFIVDFTGSKIPVLQYQAFENVDAATLITTSNNLSPLPIVDTELPVDTPLWNLSFPGVADVFALSKDAQLSSGSIQSYIDYTPKDGSFGLTRVLKHNADSGPGSSGSPLLDACGSVIGLHFAGLSDDAGAGLPGATRMAISGKFLADYIRVESPKTKFTVASSCGTWFKASKPWIIGAIIGSLVFLAIVASLVMKSRKPPIKDPVEKIIVPRKTTLVFDSLNSSNGFSVEGKFAPNENGLVIGSSPDPTKKNGIILQFPSVSRRHALIEMVGSNLLITDLNSKNGTTVNGEKILPNTPRALASGSVICCGDIEMRVTLK